MPSAVQEGGRRNGGATFGINFLKYEESSLTLYPSFGLMCQTGNQRGSFNFVWLTLLHRYNHVYITVITTAAWSLSLISILLIFIRWIFLLLWYLSSSYLFYLGCWLKMGIPVLTFSFSIPQVIQLNPRAVLLQHQSYKNRRQSLSECRFWFQRSEGVWKLHFCELSYGVASFW